MNSTVTCLIPARIASSRKPGKVLSKRLGIPSIVHTYNAASSVKGLKTIVATSDDLILSTCSEYDIPASRQDGSFSTGQSVHQNLLSP